MNTFIVRQPIMDHEEKLTAYELLYQQDSSTLYNQRDARVANAIVNFFNQVGETGFFSDKDVFVTFTPNLLMQNVPKIFQEDRLVIQIEDNVLVHPVAKVIIQRYKSQGYRLALVGFEFNNRFLSILPSVDILKVDFSDPESPDIQTQVSLAKKFGKKAAAYYVNTPRAREMALALGCDYIQGNSVAEMVTTKTQKMEHLQSNFFRLMAAITRQEPEFEEIAHLISVDVTLTFSLIKLVNSAYFSLPNRVRDVKQALTVLGLGQLRQWIYLLSFTADGGMTDELIKISFQRAVFCQELSLFVRDFPVSRTEAYLLGMFSTLGILLEAPMEEALKELSISEEVKEGLIQGQGRCGQLLELTIAYEKGEWSRVGKLAPELELPMNTVAQKYLEAVEYVNETWEELQQPFRES